MTSSDGSAAEQRIQLEPVPPSPFAAEPAITKGSGQNGSRPYGRMEAALAALVLLLAFFLASFAAHNSDVWMHLATGRLIARGEYQFGAEPFAYTTAGVRWLNTSWLSDLLGYSLANALGGPETPRGGGLLVVLKALLIVALAGVLLMIRKPLQSWWPGSVCVCLALLAMSPRLLLQPACISLFFLALTVYLLFRSKPDDTEPGDGTRRCLYLIPVVFLLWANLDDWFLLGPATVALFLTGEWLQHFRVQGGSGESRRLRTTALALVVGVAACAVNPFHVQVFTLPPELWTAFSNSPLRGDPFFQTFFLSPLQGAFWKSPQWFPSAGGIGFCLLAGLGVISFLLNSTNWQWWRVLVWLPFLLLALFHARAIPFFAVAAAPITALNLHDFAVGRLGAERRRGGLVRLWSVGGRMLTLAALVALIVFAWPGWLHSLSDFAISHRVAWRLHVDPSLHSAARDLAELRAQGVIRENGFNITPDVASYCAWFCPEEKGFFDYRFHLFPTDVAQTFVDVRRELLTGATAAGEAPAPASVVRGTFLDSRFPIDHVVLHSFEVEATTRYARRLLVASAEHWTLLRGDGRTEIFGWSKGPADESALRFAPHRLDPERQAFGASAAEGAATSESGPRAPRPLNLWEQFVRGAAPHAPGYAQTQRFLNYYETQRAHDARRRECAIAAVDVGCAGVAAMVALGPVTPVLSLFTGNLPARIFVFGDQSSSAPLLLAVRAARQSVADNPNDPEAWYSLGIAYLALSDYQKAHFPGSAILNQLREVQIVSALENAVLLKPTLREAHSVLSQVFLGMTRPGNPQINTHLDLGYDHWKEAARLERAAGPPPGVSREQFEQHLSAREDNLKKLEQALQQRRDRYDVGSKNPRFERLIARSEFALDHGLAKTALDVLEKADRSQIAPAEVTQLLDLLLRSGRLEAVRELESHLGDPGLKFLYAAALGDYAHADEYLKEVISTVERSRTESLFNLFRMDATPPFPLPPQYYFSTFQSLGQVAGLTANWAEWLVVRGLVALEAGATEAAAREFRKALALGYSVRQPTAVIGLLSARGPLAASALLEPRFYALAGTRLSFPTESMAATYLTLIRKHSPGRQE